MQTNVIKSGIYVVTENADGVLYTIETDVFNEIVNDWNGNCECVPANDAKVYFASYNGTPINPYLYNDFITCMQYIRTLVIKDTCC